MWPTCKIRVVLRAFLHIFSSKVWRLRPWLRPSVLASSESAAVLALCLGPHRWGRQEGPWATRRAISGPGARCFGCGMGPCSTQTHHSQFWRCRKPGQLPETRADRVRVGLLGLGGAYGPAIPPMLALVLEVKA